MYLLGVWFQNNVRLEFGSMKNFSLKQQNVYVNDSTSHNQLHVTSYLSRPEENKMVFPQFPSHDIQDIQG